MIDDNNATLAQDLAFDVDEATRLMRGEIAITPEHLYFAWGDIRDVYMARICINDKLHLFHLIRCDPTAENADTMQSPDMGIRHNGYLDLFDADGAVIPTQWDVKSLYPFGSKQLEWYMQPDQS